MRRQDLRRRAQHPPENGNAHPPPHPSPLPPPASQPGPSGGETKTPSRPYRTQPLAALHQTIQALHRIGAVDEHTLRRFDNLCLTSSHPSHPQETSARRQS